MPPNTLRIKTLAGIEYRLMPVPMSIMPGVIGGEVWCKFQGRHLAGTELGEAEQERLQAFMRQHRTEALTDGRHTLTLAGGLLAYCRPDRVSRQ